MTFDAEIDAALGKGRVRLVILIAMHFDSEVVRRWSGYGVREFGGHVWYGLGEIRNLPELEQLTNGAASRVTLVLSGVDEELLAQALEQADAVDGRRIEFLMQLLDEDAQPIGDPQVLDVLLMDQVTIERSAGDDPTQAPVRTLTISMASPTASRRTPSRGRYTDRDQKARSPGDRFCERVPIYVNQAFKWPAF